MHPKNPMMVRSANETEADLLSDLAYRSKSHWDYPDHYRQAYRSSLQITPEYIRQWTVLVAEASEGMLGFAAFILKEGKPMLDHLWIDPQAMGKGVGKTLFDHVARHAHAKGYAGFQIVSDPNALPFYLKMGVRQIGQVESQVWKGYFLPLLEYAIVPRVRSFTLEVPHKLERIRAFYRRVWDGTRAEMGDTLFVAEKGDELLGVVRLCREHETLVLRSMLVQAEHRKLGVGRMLLDAFEAHLMKHELGPVYCLPYAYLESFYGRIGFRRMEDAALPAFLQERLAGYREKGNASDYIGMMRSNR